MDLPLSNFDLAKNREKMMRNYGLVTHKKVYITTYHFVAFDITLSALMLMKIILISR